MTTMMRFPLTAAAFFSLFLLLSDSTALASKQRRRRTRERKHQQHEVTPRQPESTYNSTSHYEHFAYSSRIIGGQQASQGEYPYFVLWEGCGGSLIHSDIVLTAAHCSGQFSNRVTVGAHRRGSTQGIAQTRTITVRRRHPNFRSGTLANDFMVMKLGTPVTGITPIALNTNVANPSTGEGLSVMGFGTTSENSFNVATVLRDVTVNAVSHNQCNRQYDGDIVQNIMLCANVAGGGKDSCQGDSGGPIVEKKRVGGSDAHVQVGVVSWGFGCGRENFPGVYARVSGVSDWIQQQVCQLSVNPPSSCGSSSGTDDNPISGSGGNSAAVGDGDTPVRIEILTDNYPVDVAWSIREGGSNGRLIFRQDYGSLTRGLNIQRVRLNTGRSYTFSIADRWSDGICCQFGNGRFDVFLDENDVSLTSGGGNYGAGTTRQFTLSGDGGSTTTTTPATRQPTRASTRAPTRAPTPPPPTTTSTSSCVNSNEQFFVDERQGNKSCTWLIANKSEYGYLCQFMDVAVACPVICDACDDLNLT